MNLNGCSLTDKGMDILKELLLSPSSSPEEAQEVKHTIIALNLSGK